MKTLKLTIILILCYALVFFFISLYQTRNLKDAFFEWIQTLKEWKNHAVPGVLMLLFLLIVGIVISK